MNALGRGVMWGYVSERAVADEERRRLCLSSVLRGGLRDKGVNAID